MSRKPRLSPDAVRSKAVETLLLAMAVIAAVGIVTPAHADMVKAVVIYDKGCGSRFVVETPGGLALVEWYGGTMPSKGDVLIGDFDSYGMQEFYDLTTDRAGRVYVDEFWLSVDRVVEKLQDKCG